MPNPFFEFKQFKVYHDKCAMKVGTDGVLLAAWTDINNVTNVLDIGVGSGLVSLILAQRTHNSIPIDAIDIDKGAVEQTLYNSSISPFSSISVYNQSLNCFVKDANKKYDLIVSNPPYFVSSLSSPDRQRTLARHTDSLSIDDLLKYSTSLLSETGSLSIIYPYDHCNLVLKLASENDLYVKRITNVYPTPTSQPKRVLFELTKEYTIMTESNIVLEVSRHVYTPQFADLVKDFYLKL